MSISRTVSSSRSGCRLLGRIKTSLLKKEVQDNALAHALSALKSFRDASDLSGVPYLRTLAAGLAFLLDSVQLVQKNAEDFQSLIDRLTSIITILDVELNSSSESSGRHIRKLCQGFATDLHELLASITEEQKKDKHYLLRFLKAPSTHNKIFEFKCKLEDIRSNLITANTTRTRRDVKEVLCLVQQAQSKTQDIGPDLLKYSRYIDIIRQNRLIPIGSVHRSWLVAKNHRWDGKYSRVFLEEQVVVDFETNRKFVARTYQWTNKRRKKAARRRWKIDIEILLRCKTPFLPHIFGVSEGFKSRSLILYCDDTTMPVSFFFERLCPLKRAVFNLVYHDSLVDANSFLMRFPAHITIFLEPDTDNKNTVNSAGVITFNEWLVRRDCPPQILTALAGTFAGMDLSSALLKVKTAEPTTLKLATAFWNSLDYRVYSCELALPFDQVHCTCCTWNKQYSSLRAVRQSNRQEFDTFVYMSISIPQCIQWVSELMSHDICHSIGGWTTIRTEILTVNPGKYDICCWFDGGDEATLLKRFILSAPIDYHMHNYVLMQSMEWLLTIDYTAYAYSLAGTFMDDTGLVVGDTSEEPLYIHLLMALNQYGTPCLEINILKHSGVSHVYEGSPPEFRIRIDDSPGSTSQKIFQSSLPDFSLRVRSKHSMKSSSRIVPEDITALCEHVGLNPTRDLLPYLDERHGSMHIITGPILPPNWERRIMDQYEHVKTFGPTLSNWPFVREKSFFLNTGTLEMSFTPPVHHSDDEIEWWVKQLVERHSTSAELEARRSARTQPFGRKWMSPFDWDV